MASEVTENWLNCYPKGLWPVARSPAGGKALAAYFKGWYWIQAHLTSSLITWVVEQSELSANLQNIQNWEEQLHHMVELLFKQTLKGRRNRPIGIPSSSRRGSAKSWTWGGINPMHQDTLGVNLLESNFTEKASGAAGGQAEHEAAMYPCDKEGKQPVGLL